MDEETKPKQAPRRFWSAFNMLLAATASAGTIGATKLYQTFLEERPLYEAFQTKSEAQLIIGAIRDVREEVTHVRTDLRGMRQYMDERRAVRDAQFEKLTAEVVQNKLDIANLKLLMSGKVNN